MFAETSHQHAGLMNKSMQGSVLPVPNGKISLGKIVDFPVDCAREGFV